MFLTNIHRVFQSDGEPSFEDADTTDYFLGTAADAARRPTRRSTSASSSATCPTSSCSTTRRTTSTTRSMAWFKNIEDISSQLRLKGGQLSVQFDLTGHAEAQQRRDLRPDDQRLSAGRGDPPGRRQDTRAARRGVTRQAARDARATSFAEQYEDYLDLGYLEWKKVYEELLPTGKKAVLFVMTDDTRNCDEVAEYLERALPRAAGRGAGDPHQEQRRDLRGRVRQEQGRAGPAPRGEPRDRRTRRTRTRRSSRSWCCARAGTSRTSSRSSGCAPTPQRASILPEQTLGRGLRRMFRGEDVQEKVSVIGTDGIHGVRRVDQGRRRRVRVRRDGRAARRRSRRSWSRSTERTRRRTSSALDIELPVLAPRI